MSGVTAALMATVLVEVPIVVLFYSRARGRAFALALGVKLVTNTLLNRVWVGLLPWALLALVSGRSPLGRNQGLRLWTRDRVKHA